MEEKRFKLVYDKAPVTDSQKQVIERYWDYDAVNKKFVGKAKEVFHNNDMSLVANLSLINSLSTMRMANLCKVCSNEFWLPVYSRTQFTHGITCHYDVPKYFTCEKCNLLLKQEKLARARREKAEIIENIREAYELKRYKSLTGFEYKVLVETLKNDHYNNTLRYYGDQGAHKAFIETLDKLNELHLLYINRESASEWYREILFIQETKDIFSAIPQYYPPSKQKMAHKIDDEHNPNPNFANELRFFLHTNTQKSELSPDFTTLIEIKEDIILRKGTTFTAGGWIKNNGGINVTIIPTEK
ncbi:hypothetical protein SAMN05192588_1570 [Nonlabens sp. Hel1_33_55]|uniref:hypothetical protein n=1 Tax=Nonlabens sp. Hel1_33_55 TaxID=1336802 RepID=UPI000875D4C0|nr:hypothetical protein [Nonlabens sp. Hel1_33_55]SCY18684.1 hypothetical protein SAMN05192588_1570 [Nonlabens sp. Hel1_33_55]